MQRENGPDSKNMNNQINASTSDPRRVARRAARSWRRISVAVPALTRPEFSRGPFAAALQSEASIQFATLYIRFAYRRGLSESGWLADPSDSTRRASLQSVRWPRALEIPD